MNRSIKFCPIRLAFISTLIYDDKRLYCGQHLTRCGAQIAALHLYIQLRKAVNKSFTLLKELDQKLNKGQ